MKSQQQGSGFPIARIAAVFSLFTGAAQDLAIGPYKGKETGAHALMRELSGIIHRIFYGNPAKHGRRFFV